MESDDDFEPTKKRCKRPRTVRNSFTMAIRHYIVREHAFLLTTAARANGNYSEF